VAGKKPIAVAGPPPGEIRGTGVIRDKEGNVKSEFSFGGPATPEQFEKMKEVFDNGRNPDNQGA
jgi:hypothetical protein